jgi:hypothetical protein
MLSRSQMHIDKQDEKVLALQQRMRRKPRCVGGPPRVIISRN